MFTSIVFLLSKLDCNWRLRNSSYSSFNCSKLTKFSKTRFRYVSLVTVLRSQSQRLLYLPSSTDRSPVFSQAFVNFSQFNLDFHEFRNCSSNHYVFYSYSFPQISKNSFFVMPLTFASEMICCNNSFDFSESSFVTANSFRTLAPLLRSAKI